ncbi:LuxR family two component transcriptional regulator [Propionicimonas paludicola]|uniref:LuxR family two component transcriptional regulator n=1 Tax=Propionicimonas paludicola TaxID=185243 RepID=A0A2A9CNJ4_9ACTN|nr:response regulator transcription factor [Propionicimonas paludicola]PFG15963.1 LuxR family two component transcriptional regulator [Propionicimonas paludicola]
MRLLVADDAALIRAGLVGLLERAGHHVVAEAADAPELLAQCRRLATGDGLPDLVIADVRMPPTMTDDGLHAAVQLRAEYPSLPVLMLSQYVAPAYASTLLEGGASSGLGYLLKERVGRVADFLASVELVASGGVVVDPEVISQLLNSRRGDPVLGRLTPRELEVLSLMANGAANQQIADKLVISTAAVAKHVANIFTKMGLGPDEDNRRVRAVLAYLNR